MELDEFKRRLLEDDAGAQSGGAPTPEASGADAGNASESGASDSTSNGDVEVLNNDQEADSKAQDIDKPKGGKHILANQIKSALKAAQWTDDQIAKLVELIKDDANWAKFQPIQSAALHGKQFQKQAQGGSN